MKKFILFFVILFSVKIFSCSCEPNSIMVAEFAKADLVGEFSVVKVLENFPKERVYKIEVNFDKIYKGKRVKTLFVAGNTLQSFDSACELSIKKGDKFLVFLQKHNGKYVLSLCTYKTNLSKFNDKITLKRKLLNYLSNNQNLAKNVWISDKSFKTNVSESNLNKIINLKPKNQLGIYKLIFDENSNIKEVISVDGFHSDNEDEVSRIIKENVVAIDHFKPLVKNSELIIALSFYKGNKKEEPFVSTFFD